MTEYRCFHCKQVFSEEMAEGHFGKSPVEFPTCIRDRQHGCFGGPHDPYIPVRKDVFRRMETTLRSLREYVAAEGRPDGDELRVGLVNGSIWGPCYDPHYEPYELAENIAIWLREKCDAALEGLERAA